MNSIDIQKLIIWSKENFSSLVWRIDRNFYKTLVSEIMLQQTTVATVSKKILEFLEQFPTWNDLSVASEEEVMKVWKGLGYYQRARRLHRLVQIFKNEIDLKEALIQGIKIPGVGPYTQSSLRAIGMNQPALAIDANIRRVLTRYLGQDRSDRELDIFYHLSLKDYPPCDFNEALMDLGRIYCTALEARCDDCLLKNTCQSFGKISQETLKKKNIKDKKKYKLARLIKLKNGHLLGFKKKPGQWLEGYWELPTFIIDITDFKHYPYIDSSEILSEPLLAIKSTITDHSFTNFIFMADHLDERILDLLEQDYAYHPIHDGHWSSLCEKIIKKLPILNASSYHSLEKELH